MEEPYKHNRNKNAKEPMNLKLFYDSFILHSQRKPNQTIRYYIHAAVFLYFFSIPIGLISPLSWLHSCTD